MWAILISEEHSDRIKRVADLNAFGHSLGLATSTNELGTFFVHKKQP